MAFGRQRQVVVVVMGTGQHRLGSVDSGVEQLVQLQHLHVCPIVQMIHSTNPSGLSQSVR